MLKYFNSKTSKVLFNLKLILVTSMIIRPTYQNWKIKWCWSSYIKIYKCHDSNQIKLFSAKNKDAEKPEILLA